MFEREQRGVCQIRASVMLPLVKLKVPVAGSYNSPVASAMPLPPPVIRTSPERRSVAAWPERAMCMLPVYVKAAGWGLILRLTSLVAERCGMDESVTVTEKAYIPA